MIALKKDIESYSGIKSILKRDSKRSKYLGRNYKKGEHTLD